MTNRKAFTIIGLLLVAFWLAVASFVWWVVA